MATRRPALKVVPTAMTSDDPLNGYDDTFLECRGLQHSWASVGFFRDSGFVSRLVRCDRCGTEKVMTMRSNGAFVRARYEHPEGYLLSTSGVSKSDVRYEVLKRAEAQTFDSLEALRSAGKPARRRRSS